MDNCLRSISHIFNWITLIVVISSCSENPKIQKRLISDQTEYGIDVSHHQGKINWEQVKDWEGHVIKFAYIKATEGATYQDEMYHYNLTQAKKNGLLVGSYHYFRTTSGPEDQFANFKKHAKKNTNDLRPLVDVEEMKNWKEGEFHKNFKKFLDLVENYYGKKPLIYTVNSFYNHNLSGRYTEYDFMIGRYGDYSPNMRDKSDWTIWQFSENGKVKGIPKNVDIDILRGELNIDYLLLQNP